MLYEDGALVDTLPVGTPFATSPDYELIIGSNSLDRADEFYVGALADLRVWNRALTADEVASEFVSSEADPTDLVGHWRMSEGEGSVAEDASGNGHDGTIVGATWRTRECGR